MRNCSCNQAERPQILQEFEVFPCLWNEAALYSKSWEKDNSSNEGRLKDNVRNCEHKKIIYAKFCTTWKVTLTTFIFNQSQILSEKKKRNVNIMICYSSWIINRTIYNSDILGLQISSCGLVVSQKAVTKANLSFELMQESGKSFTLVINHLAYCCTYFPELFFFQAIWFISVTLQLFHKKKSTWNFRVSSSMSVCRSCTHITYMNPETDYSTFITQWLVVSNFREP